MTTEVKTYTKEEIKNFLSTNPQWMERALIVLFNRQTQDEQIDGETKHHNERGFNGCDSRYLSYCSKWILKGNHLNQKHLEKCGKKLPKYWGQIKDLIENK